MEKKVDIVVLGARFAKIRKKWGWSQAQVAKESGLSPNVVSRIEKGKRFFLMNSLRCSSSISEAYLQS